VSKVSDRDWTHFPESDHITPVTPRLTVSFTMDFSSFNAAEQAHMTKVIEKKQVRVLSLSPRLATFPTAID